MENRHTLPLTTDNYHKSVSGDIRLSVSIGFTETKKEFEKRREEKQKERKSFVEEHNISGDAKELILEGHADSNIVDYIKDNKDNLNSKEKELLIKNKIFIGMTKEQAKLILGEPNDINTTTTSFGKREQWVYGDIENREYYYFRNGELTSWQEL